MKFARIVVLLAVTVATRAGAGGVEDDLKPYPQAEPGVERWVFRVPALGPEQEMDRKVEIVAGKTLSVDCNRTWFGGNLEQKTAKGWGYPFYVLETAGAPMSTLRACPPGQEPVDTFVAVQGPGFLQRYNSKLPVVVYVPEGFQVRYRIWSADKQVGHAQPE